MGEKYSYNGYMRAVADGKITVNKDVKKAVSRSLSDLLRQEDPDFPYIFLPSEAEKIIDFVRYTEILEPLPFQQWIYSQIYGWRHKADHSLRRFNQAFISMAKKNGKTLFISPLLLYDLYFTHEAEAYIISTGSDISRRSFENIRAVINEVPDFSGTLRITRQEITNRQNKGSMKFFSSDKDKNGLGASLLVADEAAFFRDYVLFDRLRSGMKARRNRLVITISTNGEDKTLPYYEEYKKNKKILDGIYQDETVFIAIYEFDEGDDYNNSDLWIKCNPALDNAELDIPDKLTIKSIRQDLKEAKMVPSRLQRTLLYSFNMWSDSIKTWISSEYWKRNQRSLEGIPLDTLRCCGGLDISEVSDLTSFTLCFEPYNGRIPVLHKAYISEAAVKTKELHEATQYTKWIADGTVSVCPGNTIDHAMVIRDIAELAARYNLIDIGIDPNYKAQEYIRCLEEDHGITLVEVRQSVAYFSPFTKAWEREALAGKFIDPNPVMAYCLSNCEIRPDQNNNYKPFKRDGQYKNKIDLVITEIMAHCRMMANLHVKPKRRVSIYDIQ